MTLAQFMTHANLDAAQLAAQVGVGREAVRKWVRGERIPRPKQMRRIARITKGKVGPADFYGLRP
jgi:transcriptional regulator with XRE-family HTH domain